MIGENGSIALPVITVYTGTICYDTTATPDRPTSYEAVKRVACKAYAADCGLTVDEIMERLEEHSHLPRQLNWAWACIQFTYVYTPAYLKN